MNYYKVLDVDVNATDKEIKKAYRVLAKKYHPDTFEGDKKFAQDKMQEINEAYDILSNKASRVKYNEELGVNKKTEREDNAYSNSFETDEEERVYGKYRRYNIKYTKNNANISYDEEGYAKTNYNSYTKDNDYERKPWERKVLTKKEISIRVVIIISVAVVILVGLANLIINSILEIKSILNEPSPSQPLEVHELPKNEKPEELNDINSEEYKKRQEELKENLKKDMEALGITEEKVKSVLEEILSELKTYNLN